MAATLITDIADILRITIKARHDDHCDQYSRIFMVKLMLVCSIVCGISWYTDDLHCHLPGYDPDDDFIEELSHFVVSTCWIQGFYIYRELHKRNDDVAYFGITRDIDMDGFLKGKNELCKSYDRLSHEVNNHCEPMTKTFYQQYQYMPFLLAALAIVYYIPYIFFGIACNDLINLEKDLKKKISNAKAIHSSYFGGKYVGTFKKHNGIERSFWHYVVIWLVKIAYIAVSIAVFYMFDYILGKTFFMYGGQWWNWSRQNNTQQHDYMGSREFPKPANEVLPPFGYCELHLSAKDIRTSEANKFKVICELSQHVLYQYVFILLWFCVVIGIAVSVIGLLYNIFQFFEKLMGFRKHREEPFNKAVIDYLSYREIEYLDYLHKHDICLYGEVMALLRGDRTDDVDQQKGGSPPPPKNNVEEESEA